MSEIENTVKQTETPPKRKSRNSKSKSKTPQVIPVDFFEKVEFNKVREILISLCKGDEAKKHFQELNFFKSAKEIRTIISKSKSYFSSFEQDHYIPTGEYFDITRDTFLLSKENYMLDIESLFRINASIRLGHEIIKFFQKVDLYPELSTMVEDTIFDPSLEGLINKILDEEGKVRPNASPELQKISSRINSKLRELDKEFDQVLKYYKDRNMVTESAESFRNGRRVLSVPAEKKRQIKGVIHDESATGKTVFLEPEPLIRLNNDLFELESDHKTEVNRIIRQLCKDLREYLPYIRAYHALIIDLDIIGARARWARKINGEFPEIQSTPGLNFKDAYHPLLKLKNDQEGIPTIPFNLELFGKNRILLLSGPNAGGKSILMKGVVLLQVMIQCAVPIPVHPDSKPGFFRKFMADIGDQQSIENDLSTYSSRLKIMSESLASADTNTLLVIDEFGSGTDPQFGGALAESMLNTFNKQGVYGVVTTHYSNLKIFAYKNKGIVNGAMIFDQEKLKPIYEMRIGKPGSSFAFEIADKSGISKSVMKYARYKTGENTTKVEDLLVSLQSEKAEIEAKLEKLQKKERELERLTTTYNQLHKELDVRRKKVKIEARELNLRETADQNRAFENLIRELREEKKLDEAKELAAKLKQERISKHQEVANLEASMASQIKYDVSKFKAGDHVRIGSGTEIGTISWIRKSKAEVRFGNLAITSKLSDLIPSDAPIIKHRTKSVQSSLNSSNNQTPTRLDIRGMTMSDGIRMVEEFFDKAMLSNAHELTIIHGIGGGVLRREVLRIAKEYKDIKEIFHPPYESGGEGVSIIKL